MTKISEAEFERICVGIYEDRETICRHNPIGTPCEILLWMLMSILISYLSLNQKEIPCFPNETGAETYRQAIFFILKDRKMSDFDVKGYLEKLCS